MDPMDNLCARLSAFEHQTETLTHHTRTVEQRPRWWRGLACGVGVLSLLSLALPSGKAADTERRIYTSSSTAVSSGISRVARSFG